MLAHAEGSTLSYWAILFCSDITPTFHEIGIKHYNLSKMIYLTNIGMCEKSLKADGLCGQIANASSTYLCWHFNFIMLKLIAPL
jgi:hypothetical protein